MTALKDPADVVRAVCEGVSLLLAGNLDDAERETQLDQLAACYAEHTDVRHPFAPGIAPLRTRADCRRHFAQAPSRADGIERFDPVDLNVHRTGDPEVVITEFRYEGAAVGRPLSITNIFVTRVRDGLIVESRDYADHTAAAQAFAHLPTVSASVAADQHGD